jgi:nicotinamide-nucleotide amidase
MKAEILATGDEIRSGALVDSNSAYISQEMEAAGVEVFRHSCVGDDLDVLVAILKEIGRRADISVVTGGLGPTVDDLSSEAAARALGVDLVLDQEALAAIEAWFRSHKRPMSDSNRKQALFPKGARRLDNPLGTAPGFEVQIGKCRFFFLPGVPVEMRRMLAAEVIPRIKELQGSRHVYRIRSVSTFGYPESVVNEKLSGFEARFGDLKLGLRAKFPEIHVRLYGQSDNAAALEARLEEACRWVARKMGNRLVSLEGKPLEAVVGQMLTGRGATVAVAESCTGGLIAHHLTSVPGSSDYFLLSAVTYANDAKVKLLGVSADTLAAEGAVSEDTARQMAEGVRRLAGATYGLSTSGIAGPGGGTEEKPVGTVCIGLASPEGALGRRYQFFFNSRATNKLMFSALALAILRRELIKKG